MRVCICLFKVHSGPHLFRAKRGHGPGYCRTQPVVFHIRTTGQRMPEETTHTELDLKLVDLKKKKNVKILTSKEGYLQRNGHRLNTHSPSYTKRQTPKVTFK